jgi:hypothetical protein
MPVRRAERLDVPPQAGPNAVALRIESKWGTYSLFSDFAGEAVVDGMRFQGQFGLLCHAPDGQRRLLAAGATALRQDEFGFAGQPAVWDGPVRANTETALTPGTPRPAGFPDLPEGCQGYVLADDGTYWTGFPVERIGGDGITTRRFPLPKLKAFVLLALRYVVDGMGKRCQEPFPGTNDQGTLPPAPSVFQLPFPSAHFGETSPKMAIQGRCPAGSGMVGRKRRLPRS